MRLLKVTPAQGHRFEEKTHGWCSASRAGSIPAGTGGINHV